ncbi:MAG: hypothetical protein PHI35_03085 [Victivallaceae bacterium]|nr:hypothetical protein [Victivallaceae bacterium]
MKAFFLTIITVIVCGGCSMVRDFTEATREKSLAVGSDTWGGGCELAVIGTEQPLPGLSGWFGRRRVWYVSIHDAATGEAAAQVVRAGNFDLSVSAGATGVTVTQPTSSDK